MKGCSCLFFCRVLFWFSWDAGFDLQTQHGSSQVVVLWCLVLGPAPFLFFVGFFEVLAENSPSVQAQPGSIAQLLQGQTWIPPTLRNHSNRL